MALAGSFALLCTHHADKALAHLVLGSLHEWKINIFQSQEPGFAAGNEHKHEDSGKARVLSEDLIVMLMARADNETSSPAVSFASSSSLSTSLFQEESLSFFGGETSFAESSSTSSDFFASSTSQATLTTRPEALSRPQATGPSSTIDSSSDSDLTTDAPAASDAHTTTFLSVDNGKTVVVTRTIDQPSKQPSAASGDHDNSSSSSGLSHTNKIVVGVVVGVGGAIIVCIVSILFLLKRRSNKDQEGGWTFWRQNEKGDDSDLLSGELGVRDRNINQGSNF